MTDAALFDVRFTNVEKRFGRTVALHNLGLEIPRGCLFSLLGPSGCGKTTTLRLIAGFEQPTQGDVYIRDKCVTGVPAHKRNFGMVFQNLALFPHLTVADNIAFGLKMRKVDSSSIQAKVRAALELVALGGFEGRYPHQLSGGQQQRVAVARAIVFEPDVLLLDEPLSALDKLLRDQMQVELRQLQQRLGMTTVFVTHDQEEALTMSDRIAVMSDGHVQQVGSPSDIYESPANEFVASFIGGSNILPMKVVGGEGGHLRVEFDGVAFALDGAAAGAGRHGDSIKVALRPEKIRVARDAGRISAQLQDIVYRGAQTHLHMRTASGVPLTAHLPSAASGAAGFEVGTTVHLAWDDASMVVLK